MDNGTSIGVGSLPFPSTPPFIGGGDPTASSQVQGNPGASNFLKLLERLKQDPNLLGALAGQPQAGGGGAQPGPVIAQPRIAQFPGAPPPPGLGMPPTQVDPGARQGSLPAPAMQPGPIAPPSASAQLMSMMEPKAAAQYSAIMGVSDFIGKMAQKKDESQKSEAANAAQALMNALESAKTTGDYTAAQHVFENNEALFNKVYKGWMQKSEEAKKPKKQEKPPDPEVQAFEQTLANYAKNNPMTPQGQQAPSQLMGRSGAKYYIPQAAPGQAIQQQQASDILQRQRQQPGMPILSPEEKVKLQEAQYKLAEAQVGYGKAQQEAQKAETEQQIALANLDRTRSAGDTAKQLNASKLNLANLNLDLARARLANTQAQGRNIVSRGSLTHKISDSYKVKFAALDQADSVLDSMEAEKRTDYSADDIKNLQSELKQAGATTYASSLSKWLNNSRYLPDSWTRPSVASLRNDIKMYRSNLEAIRDGKMGQIPSADGSSDETVPDDTSSDTGEDIDDPLGLLKPPAGK